MGEYSSTRTHLTAHYLVGTCIILYSSCPGRQSSNFNAYSDCLPLYLAASFCQPESLASCIPDMSDRPPIVLDQGTGFVKVGYAGSNFPEQQYPSIVGRPILRAEERSGDVEIKDIMVGDDAAQVRSMLQISYPVSSIIPSRTYS